MFVSVHRELVSFYEAYNKIFISSRIGFFVYFIFHLLVDNLLQTTREKKPELNVCQNPNVYIIVLTNENIDSGSQLSMYLVIFALGSCAHAQHIINCTCLYDAI